MRLRVESDGGSRGNPGLAGAGSSVVDPASAIAGEPRELACQWEHIEKATNNVAEYHGLINGLTLAVEVAEKMGASAGETSVDVFMDSKLIVEQMCGRWKIKHPDMKPLAQQVKALEKDFAQVSYTWVPRAQNKRADELANRAMDDKDSGITFDLPEGSTQEAADSAAKRVASSAQHSEQTARDAEPAEADACQEKKPAAPDWHGGHKPTRMLLLRHGETQLSAERKFSGLGDPELTDRGQWQAAQAAQYIGARGGISAVISSPLQRAQQTAQAVVDALGSADRDARVDAVTVDDGLIEMDFGKWEGMTFTDVREGFPDEHRDFFYNSTTAPPEGESQEDVYNRMAQVVDRLVEEHEGRNIVLVSHVTPIKAIIRHALKATGTCFRTMHLDLAGLSIVEFYSDGNSVVRRVNDTHYLEG